MDERKARIAALAARAGRTQNIVSTSAGTEDDEEPKLLNEVEATLPLPMTATIGQPPPKRVGSGEAAPKAKSALELALEQARAELAEAHQQFPHTTTTTTLRALPAVSAHKKINWDLKRDIAPKMDVLDRRTQKAIVELLRERLEREVQEEVD